MDGENSERSAQEQRAIKAFLGKEYPDPKEGQYYEALFQALVAGAANKLALEEKITDANIPTLEEVSAPAPNEYRSLEQVKTPQEESKDVVPPHEKRSYDPEDKEDSDDGESNELVEHLITLALP
jgi:hypothetical protein